MKKPDPSKEQQVGQPATRASGSMFYPCQEKAPKASAKNNMTGPNADDEVPDKAAALQEAGLLVAWQPGKCQRWVHVGIFRNLLYYARQDREKLSKGKIQWPTLFDRVFKHTANLFCHP